MKKTKYALICLIVFIMTNCTKFKSEVNYINHLKNSISETYDTAEIEIKMTNNNNLKVSLKDSKFNKYSTENKQKIAKQIGELAVELRQNMPKIKKGKLIFINESNYLVVKTSDSESYNLFKHLVK